MAMPYQDSHHQPQDQGIDSLKKVQSPPLIEVIEDHLTAPVDILERLARNGIRKAVVVENLSFFHNHAAPGKVMP